MLTAEMPFSQAQQPQHGRQVQQPQHGRFHAPPEEPRFEDAWVEHEEGIKP